MAFSAMELVIHTYVGIGPIRFGMTIEEVRRVVGTPPTPFRKLPQSELETDAFDDIPLHVFYRPPGICEAIECFSPANVTLESNSFFKRPFSEVRDWLLRFDPRAEIDHAGMKSVLWGIALYAPGALAAPEEEVQAVLAFEKGYYERERPDLENI